MNLKITGLNFDVSEAVREHVALKLNRISRHAGNLISVTVTLSLDKLDRALIKHKEKTQNVRGAPKPAAEAGNDDEADSAAQA